MLYIYLKVTGGLANRPMLCLVRVCCALCIRVGISFQPFGPDRRRWKPLGYQTVLQ